MREETGPSPPGRFLFSPSPLLQAGCTSSWVCVDDLRTPKGNHTLAPSFEQTDVDVSSCGTPRPVCLWKPQGNLEREV